MGGGQVVMITICPKTSLLPDMNKVLAPATVRLIRFLRGPGGQEDGG